MKHYNNFRIVMRESGSSILEVMIAIILFAIATAGLAITIPFAMDRANVWRDQGGLNVYLEDQLEGVRRLSFTVLTVADTGIITDGDYTYRRVTTLVKPGIDGNSHATWVDAATAGTGDGLLGTGTTISRTDATVNFTWATAAPFPAMGIDQFSVRWTGYIEAIGAGVYTFYTTSDDGVRLWVNDQLIVDSWIEQSATEHSGTITLVAGQRYSIRLEYYENAGDAVCTLSWSSPAITKAIIPQSRLYSTLPKLTTVTVTKPSASLSLVGRVLTKILMWINKMLALTMALWIRFICAAAFLLVSVMGI
jgi:type II secretory pathway pseudopilin PulG